MYTYATRWYCFCLIDVKLCTADPIVDFSVNIIFLCSFTIAVIEFALAVSFICFSLSLFLLSDVIVATL